MDLKFRKKSVPKAEHKEIDKNSWNAFVDFVNKCKLGTNIMQSRYPNRIYITYNYLDIEYNYISFRYIIRDDKAYAIEFWVPDHPQSTLSCRLINRVGSVSEAIHYIMDLSTDRFV